MGFEKALGAVKVIKDQIQYRSQSLLNFARGYFGEKYLCRKINLHFLRVQAKTIAPQLSKCLKFEAIRGGGGGGGGSD